MTFTMVILVSTVANLMPMQCLGPAPNGINVKFDFLLYDSSINLEENNESNVKYGNFHILLVHWRVYAFSFVENFVSEKSSLYNLNLLNWHSQPERLKRLKC